MTALANPPCDLGQIRAAPAAPASSPRGVWVLAATILGSSMVFIDGTVVNVALPVLQSELHASAAAVQWVVEAYALFLAALIIIGGALGDRLGRKRIFLLGVSIFTIASVLCGLAPNITLLTLARALQGIGGALLAPASLALISASFDSEQRGRAIGTWSGFTAITAAIGPVLGGWLVQHGSWRAVFFINAPLAIVVLVLTHLHVGESRDETIRGRLDWPGALLATVGLAAVTFGLLTASGSGLRSPVVLAALLGGLASLVAFIAEEAHASSPMVPLGLFRSRPFTGANMLTFLLYGALSGALYFLPFNLIQVQGYSPQSAGLALLPVILIIFALSRWSGGLVHRYGPRPPLVVGPVVAAAGFALFARAGLGGSYWTEFAPAAVLLGLGMAVSVAPLTTVVMGSVGEEHAGIASGINNAVSRTASLLAIACLGLVMLAGFSRSLDSSIATIPMSSESRQSIEAQSGQLAALSAPAALGDDSRMAVQRATANAFVAGFRTVMIVAAGLALLAGLCAATVIGGTAPMAEGRGTESAGRAAQAPA